MLCVPLNASLPLQAPEAVHEVALLDDQVTVELPPLATLVGVAPIVTVGAGGEVGADTVTVADLAAEPPAPVQVSVNWVVAASAGVD